MTNILETTSEKAVILFLAAFVVFSVASILGGHGTSVAGAEQSGGRLVRGHDRIDARPREQ